MIDTMDCAEARITLGVYVLGALEPGERAAVDAHLVTCDGCQAELADLATLPALLASLREEDVAALADGWQQKLALLPGGVDNHSAPEAVGRPAKLSAARMRRRGRVAVWLMAAAAIVVAAVGGAELAGHLGRPNAGPYAGPPLGNWRSSQGSNPYGMDATVRYRPMGWGTQLAVKVSGIPAHTACAIEALGRNGGTIIAGSWTTDGNEGHVWYPASVGLTEQGVAKFVITVAGHPSSTITISV